MLRFNDESLPEAESQFGKVLDAMKQACWDIRESVANPSLEPSFAAN